MRPPVKKFYWDWRCVVCGFIADSECSCGAVSYCSKICRKVHSKAGHKAHCFRLQTTSDHYHHQHVNVKSLTSVFPALLDKDPPSPVAWSYQDFIDVGYSKSGFDFVRLSYKPCGLLNRCNSCFVNVTLQCLVATRPLFSYLTSPGRSHRSRCSSLSWCLLCELESHIARSLLNCSPFLPDNILRGLSLIGGDFSLGRQEDAHEFMRFAVEAMHSACLLESSPPAPASTLFRHAFAGRLRSEVTCAACLRTSHVYEDMMDLTLEMRGTEQGAAPDSLRDCLDRFTGCEVLEGDNMYKCSGCDDYVRAEKRISIDHAPNVLTIALKRFGPNGVGKLHNRVTFPLNLNLANYITPPNSCDDHHVYKLYGVVVHEDLSKDLAHYICYTKDFRGNWYEVDDTSVRVVGEEDVLSQTAYMLMYSRARPNPNPLIDPPPPPPPPPPHPNNTTTLPQPQQHEPQPEDIT